MTKQVPANQLYLLDANVLIRADADYYNLERIPQFWNWLLDMGNFGQIKLPNQVYSEISSSTDALGTWLKAKSAKSSLVLEENPKRELINLVLTQGYGHNLSDDEMLSIGQDPFLIAFALVAKDRRTVVTREVSKPKRLRSNRHIPDVCNDFGIRWITDFQMYRKLDFSHTPLGNSNVVDPA